ncbi:hypothetical protein IFM89_028322 [Coptis chinensis]|uniref:1-phosphatidylinositol-4-phosphate 5-kinase n=1 Tax=Coptis chinensis TaxID=261450 RepID=A0A835I6X9_9MAGN|nr:hypothetical protein IFM89_028322 [Coptis chinensis]
MVKRYFPMGTDMLVASRDCFHMGRGNIHGQMAQYMMVNDHGKVTGAGNFRWTSGAIYEGEVSGGYLHGCGTFNGTDGSIYRGAWRINVQHGLGRKQYCNLDIYEGSWKEGVKEGSGRYDWSSEDTYIGNWKAGNMCGRGVMKWASSDMYDGFWLDGLKHGSGFYRFSDGGYYFGTWSRGRKGGQGTFYPAGSKLPSLPNWYSSAGYYDDNSNTLSHSLSVKSDQTKVRRASINRSLPEKLSIGLFRSSGRISNRSVSLEKDWSFDDSAKEVRFERKLSYTVGKVTPVPMREVLSSDFGPRARIWVYFPKDGSQFTPPHRSIGFYWKDYCPMVFRNLREMFKIDAADYMMSICDGDGLREVSSAGKSGSLFYVSQDERFVIKTLKKSEQKVWIQITTNFK